MPYREFIFERKYLLDFSQLMKKLVESKDPI